MFSHPYLRYCLSALARPTAAADLLLESAYNRTARMAARGSRSIRSEPARAILGWPVWCDVRVAMRRVFASKVWEDGRPLTLRSLLPPSVDRSVLSSRLRERGLLVELPVTREICKKAFSYWGVETLNEVRGTRPSPPVPLLAGDGGGGDGDRTTRTRVSEDPETLLLHGMLKQRYQCFKTSVEGAAQVVWTDGSARSGRAGAGVFYGAMNQQNTAIPVLGVPTAQRAEVTALLYLLRTDRRRLSVRSDSKYVVGGATEWRKRWRRRAWYSRPWKAQFVPHADLCWEIDRILENGDRDPVQARWVKGHATRGDVEKGTSTLLDAWGNAGADTIAGMAVALSEYDLPVGCPHAW
jgi:ribonuclease HI